MQPQITMQIGACRWKQSCGREIFENRLNMWMNFKRMGTNIKVEGNTAMVIGVENSEAVLKAPDLRAGAALVLAGLTLKVRPLWMILNI